jgi:hypothetical protein
VERFSRLAIVLESSILESSIEKVYIPGGIEARKAKKLMSDYSILVCSFVVNKSYCSSYIVFFLCLLERVTRHTLREQRIRHYRIYNLCFVFVVIVVLFFLITN